MKGGVLGYPHQGSAPHHRCHKCFGCLNCELQCSLRFEKAFSPPRSAIQVRRLVGGATEYAISVTEKCDGCGICVRFCPYSALAQ